MTPHTFWATCAQPQGYCKHPPQRSASPSLAIKDGYCPWEEQESQAVLGSWPLLLGVEVLLGPVLLCLPLPSASWGTEDTTSRQPAPFQGLVEQPSESPLPFPPQPLCLPAVLLVLLHSQAVTGTIRPEKDCDAYCGDMEWKRKCKEQQAGEALTSPPCNHSRQLEVSCQVLRGQGLELATSLRKIHSGEFFLFHNFL